MPPLEHRLTMPVRWRDLDLLGHLNQAVYHELLEDARGDLVAGVETAHSAWVLARTELDYHVEVRRDHSPVEVVARVHAVGSKSLTLEQEIVRNDGVLAASGRTVVVAWDLEQRTSRAISDELRAALLGASAP